MPRTPFPASQGFLFRDSNINTSLPSRSTPVKAPHQSGRPARSHRAGPAGRLRGTPRWPLAVACRRCRGRRGLEELVGHTAYDIAQLRQDMERFVFLLGDSDGEPLFGP